MFSFPINTFYFCFLRSVLRILFALKEYLYMAYVYLSWLSRVCECCKPLGTVFIPTNKKYMAYCYSCLHFVQQTLL